VSTRRNSLALRVYAFTVVLVVAVMVAFFTIPRYVGSPRFLENHVVWIQNTVDRLSTRDAARRHEVIARLASRGLGGDLTLFDATGHVVESTVEPPLDAPTDGERATMHDDKWALEWRRMVVRSDDGTLLAVYAPNRHGFPWGWVLPLGAGVLVVVGAASLWFSRRLARPLGQLADAARRFGGGDMAARAKLHREDELGDVGRAFDDMADRTAQLLSSQRAMMADVSHELRTPLARIRVALELAAEDPVAAKDVLADVGTDLDEIDQLIEDILTTARLDLDDPQKSVAMLERHETRVGELADRAAERFTARHPGRVLERRVASNDREITCDAALLRRALDNLLDNAAKYSAAETSIVLEVSTPPKNGAVRFEIVDRGIGMSADELERAFTPFWRADTSRTRKTGGVGLGLALARRIARAHGGDVTLDSRPGRGTTARLEIPTG
jgi:two-component system OmpR family sensor kinase